MTDRKRLFDIACAVVGLVLAAPLLLIAAIGIRLSGPGPILYPARRAGRDGRPFRMYKLRTMRPDAERNGTPITAIGDHRIFPFGALLRRTKIDELPQLWNILCGDMSIIGPRPEDPDIVARCYGPRDRETLRVRPGLSSPGSLYHDTHGLDYLRNGDPMREYVELLLPVKLALDRVYLARWSFWYDLRLIGRTLVTISGKLSGRRRFPLPPEHAEAAVDRARPVRASGATVGVLVAAFALATTGCGTGAADEARDHLPDWLRDPDEVLLVGAGDVASCDSDVDEATAVLLDSIPGTVFTTGDNVYPDGSAEVFTKCYAPNWGRHRSRTRPAPGNHEYQTPDARGYFDYFGDAAGAQGTGWYSYDVGSWHVIALNSMVGMGPESPQVEWLREDLAAYPARCTLAYWHHPRFSSGEAHGNNRDSDAVWRILYAAGVEVVLAGHEHNYERFAPQTPDGEPDPAFGIRQFVVGTGGGATVSLVGRLLQYVFGSGHRPNLTRFGDALPTSEARSARAAGVLALRLLPSGYEWQFVGIPGVGFEDAGADACHPAPPSAAGATGDAGGSR